MGKAAGRSPDLITRGLLDHGAEVNQRAPFGGPEHGEGVTALHLAAQQGDLPMSQLLCDRGADPTVDDRIYHSTPSGWAEHGGHTGVRDYLRSRVPDQDGDGADRSSA